jgi:tetratricopeptide (TPR) repeat protein
MTNKSSERNLLKHKSIVFMLVFILAAINGNAQENVSSQINNVFHQLVNAYGSSKPAPSLVVFNSGLKLDTIALYASTPKPTIYIDANVYAICRTFEKDSLNALSVLLSHELTHYYNDHTFCSDNAYAISKNENIELGEVIKETVKYEKISKETEADLKGLFYAAAAGYSPFNIQDQLLDKIYVEYQLPDSIPGYPTRLERKNIAKTAQDMARKQYETFKIGLLANEEKNYDKAIAAFEQVNSYIPWRENYNNIGVAKTLKALDLQGPTDEKDHFPNRFKYPLEIDNTSRLNQELTRGMDDYQEEMTMLLKSAQKDFEKAISLDPNYTKGYINLACVFDLLENPNAAIGKIKELPKEQQNTIDAKRILAIAYYHNNQEELAKAIWNELKM